MALEQPLGSAERARMQLFWQRGLPELIFVGGRKRSGKDFVCDQLVAQAGFTKVHIVEPWLRQWCETNGYSPDQWETVKFHERARIQADAAAERAENPNVLIDWMRAALPSLPRPLCVTAVRFSNEMLLGMQHGALCVRVVTSDAVRTERFRAAGENLDLLHDPFEAQVDTMPVHLDVPGVLPAGLILPTLSQCYAQLQAYMQEAA